MLCLNISKYVVLATVSTCHVFSLTGVVGICFSVLLFASCTPLNSLCVFFLCVFLSVVYTAINDCTALQF